MNRILLALSLVALSQTAAAFPTYLTGGFRGADLMTSDEIKAHVGRLLSMHTFGECEAYMADHEVVLQERAKERHVTLPAKSGDPCEVMRFMGRVK